MEGLRGELKALQSFETSEATQRSVTQAITDHAATGTLPSGDLRELMMILHQDYRLFFNPHVVLPREDVIRSVREFLGKVGRSPIPDEDLPEFFQYVKAAVTKDPVVDARLKLTEEILPHAEAVHEMIRRRMEYPFRRG